MIEEDWVILVIVFLLHGEPYQSSRRVRLASLPYSAVLWTLSRMSRMTGDRSVLCQAVAFPASTQRMLGADSPSPAPVMTIKGVFTPCQPPREEVSLDKK